jgi:gluconate 2-dehydrogenase gamma chain
MSGVSRREFAQGLAALGAVTAAAGPAATRRWRVLTDGEARLAEAIAEQIVPADRDPGAREAGVVNFIDKQLAGPYRRHVDAYRKGLAGVDETSRAMFGAAFVELPGDRQVEVLKVLEAGRAAGAAWQHESSAAFFRLIRDHTMQGFYGGPQHGGNRGYASYRMLGLDYPQIIGQNRYRKR